VHDNCRVLVTRAARKAWSELRERRGREVLQQALAARRTPAEAEAVRGDDSAGQAKGAVPPDPESPYLITISRRTKKLRLYERGAHVKTYRVAVGLDSDQTRGGLYAVQNKFVDPEWKVPDEPWAGELAGTIVPPAVPENEVKGRWMGVYPGVGIHGTDKVRLFGLRIDASRGCIRMRVEDVIDLYDRVPVGTPVFIA
jgi:lipoprotein-anchoring transpeptidase ErfK/SrfK